MRKSAVTQEAASNALARSRAPVAPPWRPRLATRGRRHDQLRRQYITLARPLGTLMRHYLLLPLAPAIARRSPGMGKLPSEAALIAPPGLAQRCAARLLAARPAAVALPAVAAAAHHYFRVTTSTGEHSSTQQPGRRSSSRHRHARSSPECALRSPTCSRPQSLDAIARRCNTLPALVANTVGRGSRNNLPVIAAAAPVLHHGDKFYRGFASAPSPLSDRPARRVAQRIPRAPRRQLAAHVARAS
jgi:hypothetical protein